MEKILDYLMGKIEKKKPLKPGYSEYIRYGLDVLLSTLVNLFFIVVIGLLLDKMLLALLFILVFVPLRSFTGGYHADTKFRCNLAIIVVLTGTIWGTDWIMNHSLEKICMIIGNLLFFLPFLILAPVEHHNKPLSPEKKHRNKILGWLTYGILLAVQAAAYLYFTEAGVYMSLVLLVVGLFLVLGRWKGYLYEKKRKARDSAEE